MAQSSSNGPAPGTSVLVGVATGAAGLVGGAVLGMRLASKRRGLDTVVKQVGKAGKQFKKASRQVGELTSEVKTTREKAGELRRIFT